MAVTAVSCRRKPQQSKRLGTQPIAEKATMRRAPEEVAVCALTLSRVGVMGAPDWSKLSDQAQMDTECVRVQHNYSATPDGTHFSLSGHPV